MSDNNFKNLKIAVVHDHLGWSGGGERTALTIAIDLGADFITAYTNENTFSEYQKALAGRLKFFTRKVINKEVIRFFWLRWQYSRNRKIFQDYDVLIASGQAALESVARFAKPRAFKILYEHTPPRRVFDLYQESRAGYRWWLRPAYSVFARYWKRLYLRAADKMDYRIANSENIRERIKKFTGRDVDQVIWPPIETEKFKWIEQGDFYFSWGRLDEQKRVEMIVQAFKRLPDKKLVVASGGPRLEKIKELAHGAGNIQILGWTEDKKLFELAGKCLAAIYIPHDEDAGMTHLEANAAGKPVLGVDEGGLRETIIEGETGLKIKADPDVEDIMAGIQKMTPEWCLGVREKCEAHAQKFDRKIFSEKIREVVAEIRNSEAEK